MKGFYIAEDYLDVKFTEATMDIIMFMNSEGRSWSWGGGSYSKGFSERVALYNGPPRTGSLSQAHL